MRLKHVIGYSKLVNARSDIKFMTYLAVNSIFNVLIVGLGFGMCFRNSFSMLLPYILLGIATCLTSSSFLYVWIFIISALHLTNMIVLIFAGNILIEFLDFKKSLSALCKATLNAALLGNICALFLFAFPMLFFTTKNRVPSFELRNHITIGFFVSNFFIIIIGYSIHVYSLKNEQGEYLSNLCSSCFLVLIGAFLGLSVEENDKFYNLAVYECTRITLSIMLNIWAYHNGFSSLLYKIFQVLISLIAVIDISLTDSMVFWLTIVVCIIEILFDFALLPCVSRINTSHFVWTYFSSGWVASNAIAPGVSCLIIGFYRCRRGG